MCREGLAIVRGCHPLRLTVRVTVYLSPVTRICVTCNVAPNCDSLARRCSLALVSQSMTNRREACITFQRMTRAQLPPSEYNILRQLFQKLISGLSNAKDVHEAICAILRRHNATELLALFERLVTMGTTETSLRLLRQPCGVHVSEGAPIPSCP